MKIHQLLASLLAGIALTCSAQVENFKIMAPANPGGGYDTVARTLADALKAAGQVRNVTIENKAGAGGAIGLAQFVNTEKGNPNALIVGGAVMVGAIETNKSAVTLEMVTPIARLMGEYNVVVVKADSPLKSFKDLVAAMKANPGAVAIGGGSAGSIDHVMIAMIADKNGVAPEKINYVPFAGGGEGKAAILGGQLAAYVSGYGELADLVKAGKLRALALSAENKQAGIDVQTMKDQGTDVVVYNWRGVFAPKDISDAQRKQLVAMVEAAAKNPAWKSKAEKLEWLDLWQPADAFKPFVDAESARFRKMVSDLKIHK